LPIGLIDVQVEVRVGLFETGEVVKMEVPLDTKAENVT